MRLTAAIAAIPRQGGANGWKPANGTVVSAPKRRELGAPGVLRDARLSR